MSKEIKCPKCGSHNIQILGNNRKSFSVGKEICGAILTSGLGVGALLDLLVKKENMICFVQTVDIAGNKNSA